MNEQFIFIVHLYLYLLFNPLLNNRIYSSKFINKSVFFGVMLCVVG